MIKKMNIKVLLIIPAYNEEESILNTIRKVNDFRDSFSYTLDYVVINDGSIDNTEDLLRNENINSINLIMNMGIGGAVQTGYRYAKEMDYDIAVQFDGDGQHDINSLENLINPILNQQANLVVGSRFMGDKLADFQTTGMRRFGINIISFFIKLVTGKKIFDTTSGYRAADKSVIQFFSQRYPVKYPEPESIVHILKKKLFVEEVAVNMFERNGGKSSITPLKSIRYMSDVCSSIIISALMKEGD
ncbi:hypothetical protein IGI65_001421 [Enterococcus sp. DIV0755b]